MIADRDGGSRGSANPSVAGTLRTLSAHPRRRPPPGGRGPYHWHPAETPTAVKAATKKRTAKKAAANDNSPGREVRTIIYIEARPKGRQEGSAIKGYVVERQGIAC